MMTHLGGNMERSVCVDDNGEPDVLYSTDGDDNDV